jgi:ribonuclease Z
MRKFLILLCVFVAMVGVMVLAVLNIPTLQDRLFGRLSLALMKQYPPEFDGLRVVVFGSASPLGNDPNRAQACIAVLTPEHFFIFDVGARSPVRIGQAQLPMDRLSGVFLTHFHSDHIAALPDINLNSWVAGAKTSLQVYGPTGVSRVVNGFNTAYEMDRGYRTAHHGEYILPKYVGLMSSVPIEPGVVLRQGELSITAFTVEHSPVSPAMGYRVDYGGRSVVISGDTIAVDTLFLAARDADLLFHDALSRNLIDILIPNALEAGRGRISKIMSDVIDYHADSLTIESRAEKAGIKQLVLYHLVPVPPNALAEVMFRRGLSSDTLLARDLMIFDLPLDSDEIRVTSP